MKALEKARCKNLVDDAVADQNRLTEENNEGIHAAEENIDHVCLFRLIVEELRVTWTRFRRHAIDVSL